MGIKCGIVGLPNVGKSTLFNALTAGEIPAENYPFCTIDPNVGVVHVPDPRLDAIAGIVHPEKVVPTIVEFVDIAGLVAGASKGEGLGNQFLAHIRETDAIVHLVRCFEDGDITHVAGRVDPLDDIETIETELLLADLDTATRSHEKAERQAKAGEKESVKRRDLLARVVATLAEGTPARELDLEDADAVRLRELQLITAKPVMYLANVSEDAVTGSPQSERVAEYAAARGAEAVVISAAIEAELAQLDAAESGEFLADLGLEEPGLNRVIRSAYRLLGLKTFFTAGPREVRAWTARNEALAPEAAGMIHTDFERGFIRAEVIGYEDYMRLGGEQGAREAGRLRLEGKTYRVAEGDICHFRFNV
ncbi:MAG TPA: redox-regulated ATPase YchF [Gammaproteobacteria bacterium]|jgi:GTP-binding protein YchF